MDGAPRGEGYTARTGVVLTGGTARGAKLFGVPGRDVRPALARMRISVFEILRERLPGAVAADLFAGTGSMGLEALSRGAAWCTFVDREPRCAGAIRRNLEKLRFGDRAAVLVGDAREAGRLLPPGRRYGLVFVDPPYAMYDEGPDEVAGVLEGMRRGGFLDADAVAVVEHRVGQKLPDAWGGGALVDRRTYGGTAVSWYRLRGD